MAEKKKLRLAVGRGASVVTDELPLGAESFLLKDRLMHLAGAISARELAMHEQVIARALDPLGYFQRAEKAKKVVECFENEPATFKAWFADWVQAPDLAFMRHLLWAAQDLGVRQAARARANAQHARNREAKRRSEDLWWQLRSGGVSKNQAAGLIAKQVNLAESTVRKFLQGM